MNDALTFRKFQELSSRTDRAKGKDIQAIMVPLLGLAGEAGSLLSEYKKWLREGERYKPFTDQVSEEIGDILWYLANIADKAGLDLQDIAEENLAKLQDRYGSRAPASAHLFPSGNDRYDSHFPENERLPTEYRVIFREIEVDGRKMLEIVCNGQPCGDPLTDNAHVNDGYRFHDVFHITLATLLGWSPILRKLLKVKRKSVPQVDEVEDGARAGVVEEAIAALVFGYARDYSFFRDADTVEYELLRAIKLTTRPFEVRDKPYHEWEETILAAFDVWRQMIANNGGILIGDAARRTVRYELLDQSAF
jgi:NTP pyrophosphatase (non-canonical NTP hydrolase)